MGMRDFFVFRAYTHIEHNRVQESKSYARMLIFVPLLLAAAATSKHHSEIENDDDDDDHYEIPALHQRLFRVCMKDQKCRAQFRIEPEQALTRSTLEGFSFYMTLWTPDDDFEHDEQLRLLARHVRDGGSGDDADDADADERRRLWSLIFLRLLSSSADRVRCAPNHRLVWTRKGAYCLCIEGRLCETELIWHSPMQWASYAIIAAVVLVLLCACTGIYKNCKSNDRRQTSSTRTHMDEKR
jgi:hypothetical protein